MKKIAQSLIVILLFSLVINSCRDTDDFDDEFCGEYNGNQLYKKPDGACYYIDSEGKIVSVVSSECDC